MNQSEPRFGQMGYALKKAEEEGVLLPNRGEKKTQNARKKRDKKSEGENKSPNKETTMGDMQMGNHDSKQDKAVAGTVNEAVIAQANGIADMARAFTPVLPQVLADTSHNLRRLADQGDRPQAVVDGTPLSYKMAEFGVRSLIQVGMIVGAGTILCFIGKKILGLPAPGK